MLCSRADLHHIVAELQGWFVKPELSKQALRMPTTVSQQGPEADKLQLKEQKWRGVQITKSGRRPSPVLALQC